MMNLFERMTREEKVAQLCSTVARDVSLTDQGHLRPGGLEPALRHGIGAIQRSGDNTLDPTSGARFTNAIQRYVRDHTRLGIPVLIQGEGLHGHMAHGATVFPVAIALASTWDVDLVRQVFEIVAVEARARGTHQLFAPVVDLARDPRWGRLEETYGEDVYLVSQMAVAAVSGMQQPVDGPGVAATPKHFAGYGQAVGGRNFAPPAVGTRELADETLRPFEAAVKAGAMGIMAAHNDIDGVPCHANATLLTDLLRGRWGFNGVVVSDYWDIRRLADLHRVASTEVEAALLALAAGVDMDLPAGASYQQLVSMTRGDEKIAALVDQAVQRVLRLKTCLGLFDDPFVDEDAAAQVVRSPQHRAVARQAAGAGVIMLANDGLLPLDESALACVTVIGPHAHPAQFGGYTAPRADGVSILDGIRAALKPSIEVRYEQGCAVTRESAQASTELDTQVETPHLVEPSEEADSIAAAVARAREADVAIVCVGDNWLTARESYAKSPHFRGDRSRLDLVGQQGTLVRSVIGTGTPTVVILAGGRPLALPWVAEQASALLAVAYLGEAGGTSIADVLLGRIDPAGRLPVSIPRSVGQLPMHYSQKPLATFKGYLFDDDGPLFPFGHGLSYTTFTITDAHVEPSTIAPREQTTLTVTVTNTGDRSGIEIVQVYARPPVSRVTRPIMTLVGFSKVELECGTSARVEIPINSDGLGITVEGPERAIESGRYELLVGTRSTGPFITAEFDIHQAE